VCVCRELSASEAAKRALKATMSYGKFVATRFPAGVALPRASVVKYAGSFYDFEGAPGVQTTNLDGYSGYMQSFTLLDGAIDGGEFGAALAAAMARAVGERTVVNFHDGGGAIRRLSSTATAFARRSFNFVAQLKTIWRPSAARDRAAWHWASSVGAHLRRSGVSGAYVNYIDALLPDWRQAYYGANFARLLAVKRSVDPHNVFQFAQSISAPCNTVEKQVEAMKLFQHYQVCVDFGLFSVVFFVLIVFKGTNGRTIGCGNVCRRWHNTYSGRRCVGSAARRVEYHSVVARLLCDARVDRRARHRSVPSTRRQCCRFFQANHCNLHFCV
jgi:hypothetical protein